jgi:chromosome partitioning protein
MLIVFSNTKGGVGKSCLSAHLAIWLFDRGLRVALLDTDPQQTAARWVRTAEPAIQVVAASDMDEIRRAKGELLEQHDVIVADSPGYGGDAAHTVTLLADLVVVPLQPSKPDVRAIKDALKFVRLAQEMNSGRKPKARLVLTFTAKGDVQTRRLRNELTGLGVEVAKSEIRRLNASSVRANDASPVASAAEPQARTACGRIPTTSFSERDYPALSGDKRPAHRSGPSAAAKEDDSSDSARHHRNGRVRMASPPWL